MVRSGRFHYYPGGGLTVDYLWPQNSQKTPVKEGICAVPSPIRKDAFDPTPEDESNQNLQKGPRVMEAELFGCVRALLNYSFEAIGYDYYSLTNAEKNLVTKPQFAKICAFI